MKYSNILASNNKQSIDLNEHFVEFIKNSNNKIAIAFHHEIMKYLTNIIINKNEQLDGEIDFPYVNKTYVNNPFLIDLLYKEEKLSLAQKIINNFPTLGLKKICVSPDICIGKTKLFLKKGLIYKFKYKNEKLLVNTRALQDFKIFLNNLVSNMPWNCSEIIVDNFLAYIAPRLTYKNVDSDYDLFICGSPAKIDNRIIITNCLDKKINTIAVGHGEQSMSAYDEPFFDYAEFSLVNYYVDYGKKNPLLNYTFFNSHNIRPTVFYRSSDFIKSVFLSKKVSKLEFSNSLKILYVPNTFNRNIRYGPFRDISDTVYKKWQESILRLDYGITYKKHPKSSINIELNYSKIEKNSLNEIFHDYDFYVLDYFSTASAVLVATNKPIIYFNLGMRNIAKNAFELLSKRVFWVDINLDLEFGMQIQKAITDYNASNRQYVNEYTQTFSLAEHNKSESEVLESVLTEALSNSN